MDLDKYNSELEDSFSKEFEDKCEVVVNYLKDKIKDETFEESLEDSSVCDVYTNMNGYIYNFYEKELLEAFKKVNYDIEKYKLSYLDGFILSKIRNSDNVYFLYNFLQSKNIIDEVYEFEDGSTEIHSKDFGVITFFGARDQFLDEKKFIKKLYKYGDDIIELCHAVTFDALEYFKDDFKAVTGILTRSLDEKYIHSFILDPNGYVLDFANDIIMDKDTYYLINDVKELNVVNYDECIEQEKESIKYDSSKTLYTLLRNALYKKYLEENK